MGKKVSGEERRNIERRLRRAMAQDEGAAEHSEKAREVAIANIIANLDNPAEMTAVAAEHAAGKIMMAAQAYYTTDKLDAAGFGAAVGAVLAQVHNTGVVVGALAVDLRRFNPKTLEVL